jgi:hypothetical protein
MEILEETFAVCRLPKDAPVPEWAAGSSFLSITRTREELSIVCDARLVPAGVRKEDGWRCLAVEGPLDFAETGVAASIAAPLANAGVSVLLIATFDTDFALVRSTSLELAVCALQAAGHTILR